MKTLFYARSLLSSFTILIAYTSIFFAMQPPSKQELIEKLRATWSKLNNPPSSTTLDELLEGGADINTAVYGSDTSLHRAACDDRQFELVKVLLAHKACIDRKGILGSTALHNAVTGRAIKNITLLLDEKADVNAKTHLNDTPLHLLLGQVMMEGTKDCDIEMAKILLDKGARLDICIAEDTFLNKRFIDKTPLQVAVDLKLPTFIDLFLKDMANPLYDALRVLKKDAHSFFAMLPVELLRELALLVKYQEHMEDKTKKLTLEAKPD